MSFLGDIVNSIGSGKAPTPPKPPARPISENQHHPNADVSKPGARIGFLAVPSPLNGTKRKADDEATKLPEKHGRPNPTPGLTGTINRRTAAPPLNAPKPSQEKSAPAPKPKLEAVVTGTKTGSTPPLTPITSTAKPPVKGSYADIMARARQAQETKAQTQVGMIKHQATNREKVSKLAERRKQEEEKAKAAKERSSGRPGTSGKPEKGRSVSPTKKTDQSKAPKVARPPLHAPPSAYKGTIGTAATRPRQAPGRKKSRYDDYLGTDEEENSDMDDEEQDYESDVSSDMEAGAFDIDEEEDKALRAAKEDDARELAEENRLKREKEERRKRLISLAGRRK